jgi:hypothetical protein
VFGLIFTIIAILAILFFFRLRLIYRRNKIDKSEEIRRKLEELRKKRNE